MVQYKGIAKNQLNANQIAELFDRNVEEFKREFLTSVAEVIAQTSPVDTGTYARSHEVALRSGSFQPTESSHGKPRRVPSGPPRAEGLGKMLSGIASVDAKSENIVFRNRAIHAKFVEREYNVYNAARREVSRLVNDAASKLGMKIK